MVHQPSPKAFVEAEGDVRMENNERIIILI
jgi:hypothetical protein